MMHLMEKDRDQSLNEDSEDKQDKSGFHICDTGETKKHRELSTFNCFFPEYSDTGTSTNHNTSSI